MNGKSIFLSLCFALIPTTVDPPAVVWLGTDNIWMVHYDQHVWGNYQTETSRGVLTGKLAGWYLDNGTWHILLWNRAGQLPMVISLNTTTNKVEIWQPIVWTTIRSTAKHNEIAKFLHAVIINLQRNKHYSK